LDQLDYRGAKADSNGAYPKKPVQLAEGAVYITTWIFAGKFLGVTKPTKPMSVSLNQMGSCVNGGGR